jgi:hypothetical protein
MTPEQKICNTISNNLNAHIKAHPHSPAKSLVQKIMVYAPVSLLVIGSLVALLLFLEQSRVAQLFNPFIGASFVGYVWMWFPELLLFSIVLFGLGIVVLQVADFDYKRFLKVATPVYLLLAIFSLVFTPVTSTVAETVRFESLSTLQYRLNIRDSYVEVLAENNEFFGVTTYIDCNSLERTLSIDHGGVIKEFIIGEDVCNDVDINSLVWVEYADNTLIDYKILD